MASFSGSAAVTASMNVPQTQNTAPVIEFLCLFTTDIRRKQKRWSDGRLKFHTFNKRVMVYDDRSNFVGDTHWREDSELAEGEELALERSGTLVEVGQCVGKRDQDLTELVDKRVKEREERAAAKAATPAASKFRVQDGISTPNLLRPKPLNALVTPTGHYGRALVPGTSPFQERQGHVPQEKDEREHPAKRRKTSDITSSKSGYAQNLLGATLNLSSSRPPSTGPIRYEPLRVTPSIPVRSTAIDLTLDDSDSDQSSKAPRNKAKESASTCSVQKKARRSPPPRKSGYASNLTGVALTLSRPDNVRPSRPSNLATPRILTSNNSRPHDTCSEGEESFNEAISEKRQSALKVSKSKEQHKPQKSISPQVSSSSPPPARKQKSVVPEKETRRPQSAMQDSSILEPTPDRPMSALRIKGRSGPKMMMLMNRPSSRATALSESSGSARTKSAPLQKRSEASNDVVLSQATMELNAFCQKQEERLQARLGSKRRTAVPEADDNPSSSDDANIDHQKIDRLLSRRKTTSENNIVLSSNQDQGNHLAVEQDVGGDAPQVAGEERIEMRHLLSSDSIISSPPVEPTPDSLGSRSNSLPPDVEISQEHISNPAEATSLVSQGQEKVQGASSKIAQPAHAVTYSSGSEFSSPELQKTNSLPSHLISDMQAATARFRAMIKFSPGQEHDLSDLPPRLARPEGEIEVMRPPMNQEPTPRVPLKAFSELIQPTEDDSAAQHEDSDANQVITIEGSMPASVPEPPAVQSGHPLRRVLVNPATRGKSVQTLAANTVDTLLNDLPSVMAPPPRRETINNQPDLEREDRGPAPRKVSDGDGGPWSREAFDLFDRKTCERIMTLRAATSC